MFRINTTFQGGGQLPDTKLLSFDMRDSSERFGVRHTHLATNIQHADFKGYNTCLLLEATEEKEITCLQPLTSG